MILGLLPAFGSAIYKGVLLSTNAQPGWRDARWLGGYLTNSALLLGCAQMLVLSVVMGQEHAAATFRIALVVLLVLNVIPLGLLVVSLRAELVRTYPRGQLWGIGMFAFGGGTLIPLGLVLVGSSAAFDARRRAPHFAGESGHSLSDHQDTARSFMSTRDQADFWW